MRPTCSLFPRSIPIPGPTSPRWGSSSPSWRWTWRFCATAYSTTNRWYVSACSSSFWTAGTEELRNSRIPLELTLARRAFDITASPLQSDDPDSDVVLLLRDVTRRRQDKRKFKKIQRQLQRMAHGAYRCAHGTVQPTHLHAGAGRRNRACETPRQHALHAVIRPGSFQEGERHPQSRRRRRDTADGHLDDR